ncbi:MAG: adenylate kinase [Gammaproteobacteria bacterium]|nr:adenylate kinase [Gammaproteobacteria bacterium]
MRIIFLGAPGTGKGTQSALAAKQFQVPMLAPSDTLRAAITGKSTLGRQAKAAMDVGQIVNDEIVLGIIEERIAEDDAKKGFVLDGYPRNLLQAEALDQMFLSKGVKVDAVILLSGDSEELMQRLVGRRTCRDCGSLFNAYTNPTMMDGQCDNCGGRLSHRPDDNEESVSARLRYFETQTVQVLEYYRQQGKLYEFDASVDIDLLKDEIISRLTAVQNSREVPQLADVKAVFDTIRQEQEATERDKRKKPTEQKEITAVATKKAAPKKAAPKKAAPKKEAPKKAAPKKAAPKKAAPKKAAPKKAAPKKAAPKKVAPKKVAPKKAVAVKKKPVSKKVPAKKATTKKKVVKKTSIKKKVAVKKKKR